MGWCHEFGVEITAGCDHLMVASTGCCECPECGTRCTGKFGGCEAVWARGPVAVQLVGREAPAPRRPEPIVAPTPPTWAPLPANPQARASVPPPGPSRAPAAPAAPPGGGAPRVQPAAASAVAPTRPPAGAPPRPGAPPGPAAPQDRNGRRDDDRAPRRSTQPPGAAELHALRDTLSAAGVELKGRIDQLTGDLEEFELRTRDEIIRRATEATLKAVGLELSKRDAQYNELHKTVATASTSLKRQVDELSAGLEGVQSRVGELPGREGVEKQLKTGLESTRTEVESTRTEVESTRTEVTKLQESLTTTVEKLQEELTKAKGELTKTQGDLAAAQGEMAKTNAQLAEFTKANTQLAEAQAATQAATQAEMAKTNAQLGKTQTELGLAREQLDQSAKRVDRLDQRLGALPDGDVLSRQLNAMLTQALAGRDTKIEALDTRMGEIGARLGSVPETDALLRRVKATMTEALTARDTKVDSRMHELRETLAAAAAAIETLEQRVAAAPQAEAFDERVTAAETRLTESQRKVVSAQQLLKRQLDQLTTGLTGVQTAIKALPDENEVNRRVRSAVVETVTDALVARDTQVQELREAQGRDRMGLEAVEARVAALADKDEIVRATNATMSEAFTPRDRRLKKLESDVGESSKALERRFEDNSGALQRRIDELAGKLIALESRVSDMPDEEELVRSMGQIVARALSGEIAQSLTTARRGPERGPVEPRRPERPPER